jgi:hypothetical protein
MSWVGSALIAAEAPQRVNADGTISIIDRNSKHRREGMQDSAQPLPESTPGSDFESSPSPSPSGRIQPESDLHPSKLTSPLNLVLAGSVDSIRHSSGAVSSLKSEETKPSIFPSTSSLESSPTRPTNGVSTSSPEKAASATKYSLPAHPSPARPAQTSDRVVSTSLEKSASPTKYPPSVHSSPARSTKEVSTPSSGHATSASSDMSTDTSFTSPSITVCSHNNMQEIPLTGVLKVITVSSSGKASSVTYTSTYTSSGSIGPTPAWMCLGPLCDSGGGCLIPIFCAARAGAGALGDVGPSWGLCCGWEPSVSYGNNPGGPIPAPGLQDYGSSPGKGGGSGNDNEPDDSTVSKTHSSTTTSRPTSPTSRKSISTTSSKSSTSARSSRHTSTTSGHSTPIEHSKSSCTQTSTASSCGVIVLKFTPSGSKSATTSTYTVRILILDICQPYILTRLLLTSKTA